ncbi:beta-ketoacyl synthase chain length factor [Desulfovibrio litoralis]|nr:beta-ketoacyl synthase chain length factor [Desulfovibrio litoralis]
MNEQLVIESIGVLGSFGHGIDALFNGLKQDVTISDSMTEGANFNANVPEILTDTSIIQEFIHPKKLRQVDHFTRLGLLSIFYALKNVGLSSENLQDTGIILVSGYGPIKRTFDFLNSIVEFGPKLASPLMFSLSVHNIPTATIALLLGQKTPYTTICQPKGAVLSGLQTAELWLKQRRVKKVLLVAIDEYNTIFHNLAYQLKLNSSLNTLENPNASLPYVLGESAVCFYLSLEQEENSHKTIITNFRKENITSQEHLNNFLGSDFPVCWIGKKTFQINNQLLSCNNTALLQLPTAQALSIALMASNIDDNALCCEKNIQCVEYCLDSTCYSVNIKKGVRQ